ncbi:efflux RND transporter periplasmic adaptor subunit [Sulfitobacter mediterraneus]|jgi:membrane fusion protein, multidrug efflux system|uniref:efflux RND transporter periplasmic adaptor subunit n=1 Tax=Sulfitobacter TaxID=60136 RepID=UPI00193457F1|nr:MULTISPECIES: efflux RND transporter periplasmic adaptor subunit [Sulfitobacter]MBM1631570.1 efflux RND transporter periplasmic adaptor subunit [Sulfitobacter mediterraneus]MBM1639385.1 efflux RND transporter periplasmic adaptor subunit [Sulfitobacter mediterraneus]MBM1643434.1 efflux RND transporter periplasmic adaptor subunit [Sulfitobacter mediterraneus]MBM1647480.1 efflux RND transporter periplasmic adaptor subunit [Sulfitobacter mediterraneus]MBM1651525.1 efflux RND transporter peripla
MRIFSILAALVVTVILAMSILARPQLMALLGMNGDAEAAQDSTLTTGEAGTAEAATQKLVKVLVRKVIAEQVDSAVILRGQTAAARQVDVKSETSAIVASAPLRKGTTVEEGQALCVLDPGTRGSALDEARARLAEARSRVPESEARVDEAQARLEEAKINQNAASRLIQDGFASQTRVASADASVAAAKAAVSSATSGLSSAKASIEAATASVASAEKEIERLTIRAPFGGLLESDTAELGSLLQPGALCATIIQLDPIKLVGFVPETEVNRVSLGARAGAQLAAGGKQVFGEVVFLSRSADPQTRTFRVEIDVANSDLAIRDGQTAEIGIASAGVKAHLIPQSALTLNDDGALGVRMIDDAAVVAFAPVEIMRDTPDGIWVTGLPLEADIIVVGQEYVTAGVTVAPTWEELSQ